VLSVWAWLHGLCIQQTFLGCKVMICVAKEDTKKDLTVCSTAAADVLLGQLRATSIDGVLDRSLFQCGCAIGLGVMGRSVSEAPALQRSFSLAQSIVLQEEKSLSASIGEQGRAAASLFVVLLGICGGRITSPSFSESAEFILLRSEAEFDFEKTENKLGTGGFDVALGVVEGLLCFLPNLIREKEVKLLQNLERFFRSALKGQSFVG
jgi:hypothetical protein